MWHQPWAKALLLSHLFLSYNCYACETRRPLQVKSELYPRGCYRLRRCGDDGEGTAVGWAQLWPLQSKSLERDTISCLTYIPVSCPPRTLFSLPMSLFPKSLDMNVGTCELPSEWRRAQYGQALCAQETAHPQGILWLLQSTVLRLDRMPSQGPDKKLK